MKRTRIDRFKTKRLMESRGFSALQDLADAASISQTTLYSVLDTYAWRCATLDAIANALGCSPLDILTVDEVESADAKAPPAPSAADTAREKQRAALLVEAERREALLRQADGIGKGKGAGQSEAKKQ